MLSKLDDPQISGMEIYRVIKSLARISKIIKGCNLYQKRTESVNEKEGIIL